MQGVDGGEFAACSDASQCNCVSGPDSVVCNADPALAGFIAVAPDSSGNPATGVCELHCATNSDCDNAFTYCAADSTCEVNLCPAGAAIGASCQANDGSPTPAAGTCVIQSRTGGVAICAANGSGATCPPLPSTNDDPQYNYGASNGGTNATPLESVAVETFASASTDSCGMGMACDATGLGNCQILCSTASSTCAAPNVCISQDIFDPSWGYCQPCHQGGSCNFTSECCQPAGGGVTCVGAGGGNFGVCM